MTSADARSRDLRRVSLPVLDGVIAGLADCDTAAVSDALDSLGVPGRAGRYRCSGTRLSAVRAGVHGLLPAGAAQCNAIP